MISAFSLKTEIQRNRTAHTAHLLCSTVSFIKTRFQNLAILITLTTVKDQGMIAILTNKKTYIIQLIEENIKS